MHPVDGNPGRRRRQLDPRPPLIGAKLNVANNGLNWPLLVPLIAQADTLLCGFAGLLPYKVKSSSAIGQQMTAIATSLAALTQ